jgi:hypothetical protein
LWPSRAGWSATKCAHSTPSCTADSAQGVLSLWKGLSASLLREGSYSALVRLPRSRARI